MALVLGDRAVDAKAAIRERWRGGWGDDEMRAVLVAAVAILGLAGSAVAAFAQGTTAGRAPPRITITPRQPAASPYPSPGAAFPGPGHVRECTSWLEQDPRPSGTVIVPRMRCWWVRGQS
jgi:hypothetical protein